MYLRTVGTAIGTAASGAAVLTAGIIMAAGPAAASSAAVTATPSTGLVNGQSVTYQASGFGAGDTLVIDQCIAQAKGQQDCLAVGAGGVTVKAGADGTATGTVAIVVGAVGTGVCDATHPCVLSVTDLATIGQGPGGAPVTVTTDLTFQGASGPPAQLPRTGAPGPGGLAGGGAALVGGGVVLLLAARGRRGARTAG